MCGLESQKVYKEWFCDHIRSSSIAAAIAWCHWKYFDEITCGTSLSFILALKRGKILRKYCSWLQGRHTNLRLFTHHKYTCFGPRCPTCSGLALCGKKAWLFLDLNSTAVEMKQLEERMVCVSTRLFSQKKLPSSVHNSFFSFKKTSGPKKFSVTNFMQVFFKTQQ